MRFASSDIYRLAALASVDWRTAKKALYGEIAKGPAAERLRAALADFQPTAQPAPLALSSATKPQA